jgi:hypothetical protein
MNARSIDLGSLRVRDPDTSTLRRLRLSLVLPAGAALVLWAGLSQADTIFLKDGTQIRDCKVVRESDTSVSAQTPVGDMVIPRSKISSIQKVRTPFDTYTEQLARLSENDAAGFFKLAQWCRGEAGLRKESDELLERVIDLEPSHAAARKLLGHLQVGGDWVIPEPLLIQLKVAEGAGKSGDPLREQIATFLGSRKDVRVSPAGKDIDLRTGCSFTLSATTSRKGAPTFYGKSLGNGELAMTVSIESNAAWIGKKPMKTSVTGQVPSTGADAATQGLKNALGGGGPTLHKFLDQVLQNRTKVLLAELESKRSTKPGKGAKSVP